MDIEYHRDFRKEYKRLDKAIQEKFKERRNLFFQNAFHPLLDNHKLEHELSGCRSINVTGDYRAIFEFKSANNIEFVSIGTHHQLFGK